MTQDHGHALLEAWGAAAGSFLEETAATRNVLTTALEKSVRSEDEHRREPVWCAARGSLHSISRFKDHLRLGRPHEMSVRNCSYMNKFPLDPKPAVSEALVTINY